MTKITLVITVYNLTLFRKHVWFFYQYLKFYLRSHKLNSSRLSFLKISSNAICIKQPIFFAKERFKTTILRSPHVFSKAKENFAFKLCRIFLSVYAPSSFISVGFSFNILLFFFVSVFSFLNKNLEASFHFTFSRALFL